MPFTMTRTNKLTSNSNNSTGNFWSMNRLVSTKDAGGGKGYFDSSTRTEQLRRNAIGKGQSGNKEITSYGVGPATSNTANQALRRARSSGSVAPAKKGAK